MKNISKQDKIDFYLQFTDKDFQKKLHQIDEKYFKIGLNSIRIMLAVIFFGLFLTPWIVFAAIPGLIIPIAMIKISNKKFKKEVNKLNKNITYEMLVEMKKSGEWMKISREVLSEKESDCKQAFIKNEQEISKQDNQNNTDFLDNNYLEL